MTPLLIGLFGLSVFTIASYTVYMSSTENESGDPTNRGIMYNYGRWYDGVFFNHGRPYFE